MVICLIIDSLGGSAAQTWFLLCVIINLADLIIYSGVGILIRYKSGKNDIIRKAFRSLQIVMLSVAAGWLINALMVGVILPAIEVPASQLYFYQSYFGILPN